MGTVLRPLERACFREKTGRPGNEGVEALKRLLDVVCRTRIKNDVRDAHVDNAIVKTSTIARKKRDNAPGSGGAVNAVRGQRFTSAAGGEAF